METIGEEILRMILLKLPTRDVARSSYVSRLWSILLRDPSFRRLHGKAAHVSLRLRRRHRSGDLAHHGDPR
jgi:hypothetical protein